MGLRNEKSMVWGRLVEAEERVWAWWRFSEADEPNEGSPFSILFYLACTRPRHLSECGLLVTWMGGMAGPVWRKDLNHILSLCFQCFIPEE